MRHLLLAAALAIGLTACSTPGDQPSASAQPPSPTAGPSGTSASSGFVVTSRDFADGEELADWATASAYGGQCTGDNLNPALDWSNVPAGTKSFAITLIDRSANNYIHWVHFDIPGDSAGVPRGGSTDLAGAEGATSEATPGYFGPCPPGPNHRYEFTVYALDAPIGLEEGARFADVKKAIDEHVLGQATITGMRTGPAGG